MDSDYSEGGSDDSEVVYRPGADEEEDDEEYVEVEDTPKRPKQRTNKRSKSSSTANVSRSNNKRRRTREVSTKNDKDAEEQEELELEQMSSPRRRGNPHVVEEEEEGEEEGEEEEEEEEEGEGEVDQELTPDIKIPSEDVGMDDEIPAPTPAAEEEELRETTEDSMKPNGTNRGKSKMLTELLGDGSGKKNLTDEEVALRRAENARKRKNLSEKRLEEEKQETINKLLRRRAGKSRSHVEDKEDENESKNKAENGTTSGVAGNESTNFNKPRRPYVSNGMNRTLSKTDVDLYCTVEQQPAI